jgi:hypothetical protein
VLVNEPVKKLTEEAAKLAPRTRAELLITHLAEDATNARLDRLWADATWSPSRGDWGSQYAMPVT